MIRLPKQCGKSYAMQCVISIALNEKRNILIYTHNQQKTVEEIIANNQHTLCEIIGTYYVRPHKAKRYKK